MERENLDIQTAQLSGALSETLRDLIILEYRAGELKLACKAAELGAANMVAPSIDWRSDRDADQVPG